MSLPPRPSSQPRSRRRLQKLDEKLGLTPCLILTVSEHGYGKRTDVRRLPPPVARRQGRHQHEGAPKVGKVVSIQPVSDTTESLVISQFGKSERPSASTPTAIRSTSGVRPLNLESDNKVARATVIPRKTQKPKAKTARSCSNRLSD